MDTLRESEAQCLPACVGQKRSAMASSPSPMNTSGVGPLAVVEDGGHGPLV